MESNENINTYKKIVEQKVGRNVLQFQELELKLKALLSLSKIEGTLSELAARLDKRGNKIKSKTMGQLASQYTDEVLNLQDELPQDPDDLKEAFLRFRFWLDLDDELLKSRTKELTELVSERNDLVHHFLQRNILESKESRDQALNYLDQQHKKIQSEIRHIDSQLEVIRRVLPNIEL